MKVKFDPALPIYTQIVDIFKQEICNGNLAPGEKIPPVRELALKLGVNPNTLQRAMIQLEREGLLYTERTSGRFVTNDTQLIQNVKNELISNLLEEFLNKMTALGCSTDQIKQFINMKGEIKHE